MILSEICTDLALSAVGGYISLLISVVLFAFVGSFSHCTFMCGPFVLTQISTKEKLAAPATEWQRLKGAALLPYHFGRITTYSFLGGIFALLSSKITFYWSSFTGTLLLITGIIFVIFSLNSKKVTTWLNFRPMENIINTRFVKKITYIISQSQKNGNSYILGTILGFIPCAMVYIALSAAATTGSFTKGFFTMTAFGVSTIPALFTLSLLGKYITDRVSLKTYLLNKTALFIAGSWLCFIAIKTLTK